MLPPVDPLTPEEFRPDADFDPLTYDRVVGLGKLYDPGWLARGLELSRTVARVTVGGFRATGFLIADDVMLTNRHVLQDEESVSVARAEFNYQVDWNGVIGPVRTFGLDPDRYQPSEREDLDYAIVGLQGSAGTEFGHVDLNDSSVPRLNEFVAIIEQPNGSLKQLCLTDNKVASVTDSTLSYTAATAAGSSGSPVFNERWQLVGLHAREGGLSGPDSGRYYINSGIRIDAIMAAAELGEAADREVLLQLVLTSLRSVIAHLYRVPRNQRDLDTFTSELVADPRFATAMRKWLAHAMPDVADAAAVEGYACAAAFDALVAPRGHESLRDQNEWHGVPGGLRPYANYHKARGLFESRPELAIDGLPAPASENDFLRASRAFAWGLLDQGHYAANLANDEQAWPFKVQN
jgi:V8-like Glu-specific endopeptidase